MSLAELRSNLAPDFLALRLRIQIHNSRLSQIPVDVPQLDDILVSWSFAMSKYASRSCKRYQTLLKMCRTSSKYRACGRKPHRLFRLEGTSVPRHIHSTAPCLRGSCRTPHLYLVLLSETHTKKKKSLRFDVAWFFFRSFFLSFFRPFFFLLFSFSYFFFAIYYACKITI